MRFLRRIRFWLFRRDLEDGFEEEVRQHLEMKVQENIERGMPEKEASRQARVEFGNPTLAREHVRQGAGFPLLESVLQDFRYAVRQLRQSPGFTTVAVCTLALGIGANSAMFSLVNAFLLRSLPVTNPSELVIVRNSAHGFDQRVFEQLRNRNHTLAGLIAWDQGKITVTIDGATTVARIDFVSDSFYPLLGVQAAYGRLLTPEDDVPGKAPVAVISYAYWKGHFGQETSILGKAIQLKDTTFTIVGVAPPWFRGFRTGGPGSHVTVPAQWHEHLALKDNTTFDLFGRLAPTVDLKQAQADLNLIYHQELQAEAGQVSDPERRKALLERSITVMPRPRGALEFEEGFALQLRLLEAVAGLVLLIACMNLANLLLARGNARKSEIGIRLALGGGRGRIVRQLLTENLLLALCGGALGLILSMQLVRLLLHVLQGSIDAALLGVEIDRAVLAFTAGLSIVTGIFFGLVPAWRASGNQPANALRGCELSPAGRPPRASRMLVAPQIAISLVVLILAGLLLRSLQRLQEVDLGFEHEHLLTFWVMPTLSGYEDQRELDLYDNVLAGLNQLPGVRSASLCRWSLLHRGESRGLWTDGQHRPETTFVRNTVAPRFFETIRVPLLLGRDFSARDNQRSLPVAIINESMAHKYFAGENALGRSIRMERENPRAERTIVGVVKDMRFSFRDDMPAEAVYLPYAQSPAEFRGQAMIKVSTLIEPDAMGKAIGEQVHATAKDLPPVAIMKEDDLLDNEKSDERSLSSLLAGFGGLALGLALLGLYGTVSYSVSRRIREIAIRMALGAQRQGLLWMIVRESLRLVLAGAVVGALLAAVASRALESFLFETRGFDPPTYLALTTGLLVVATLAAYVPARRVVKVDPIVALRHE
jgi:predicted permease